VLRLPRPVPAPAGFARLLADWRPMAAVGLAVMLAALGVWQTTTAWPDLIVAGLMAGLFLFSAVEIIRRSRAELRRV